MTATYPGRPPATGDGSTPSPTWLIVGGSIVAIIGAILLFAPTFGSASVTIVTGISLLAAGVGFLAATLLSGSEGGRMFGIVVGGLLALTGFLLMSDVLAGAMTLTAILIAWLLVDGVVGSVDALVRRDSGWGVRLFTSGVAFLLGLLLWSEWPTSAEWVLGVYAGIVLLLRGLTLVLAGFVLRRDGGRHAVA